MSAASVAFLTQASNPLAPKSDAGQPIQLANPVPGDVSQARLVVTATSAANAAITPIATIAPAPEPVPSSTLPLEIAVARQAEPAPLPAPSHAADPLSAASSAAPESPASQVARALVEPVKVVLSTPSQQSAHPQILSIKLDPVELGKVEIRIERSGDGSARVDLVAERPETLQRLVHDQPQLQQMLDQAGIPSTNRSLHFSLGADTSANSSASGFTAGGDAGAGTSGGNSQRSYQGYQGGNASDADLLDRASSSPNRTRSGLDITA